MTQHGKRHQRYQGTHCHDHKGGKSDVQQRITGQLNTPFEADGEQQKNAQRLIKDAGNLQI